MTWIYNEVVTSGNSTARVKYYNEQTGLIVLYDIRGTFGPGSTIVGEDSGTTLTLTNFSIDSTFDLGYDDDDFEAIFENTIYDEGSGEMIALDDHFTGKKTQDYQTKYLVVKE